MAFNKIPTENDVTDLDEDFFDDLQDNIGDEFTNIRELMVAVEDSIGLGKNFVPTINNKDVNNVSFNGFRYLQNSNYGGTALPNCFFFQLMVTDDYKFQIYLNSTNASSTPNFRRKINGTWESWRALSTI